MGGSATEVTSLAPQLGCRSWLSSHTASAVNTKLITTPSLSACVTEAGKLFQESVKQKAAPRKADFIQSHRLKSTANMAVLTRMPAEMQHKEMQKAKNTFTGFGGSCGKTKALIRVTCVEENKDEDFTLARAAVRRGSARGLEQRSAHILICTPLPGLRLPPPRH